MSICLIDIAICLINKAVQKNTFLMLTNRTVPVTNRLVMVTNPALTYFFVLLTNRILVAMLREEISRDNYYSHVRRTNENIGMLSKIRSWAKHISWLLTLKRHENWFLAWRVCVCAKKFVSGYLTDKLTDLNENFCVCCNWRRIGNLP